MNKLFAQYLHIDAHIWRVLAAEFCQQLINATFLLILNLFMQQYGYVDYEIAGFTAYRFLSIIIIAFPLGLFIKGRALLPVFKASAWGLPVASVLIIYATTHHSNSLLYIAFSLWGAAYTLQQVAILPYILRNANNSIKTEAISLKFAAWSLATVAGGVLVPLFNNINPQIFSERNLLMSLSILGFGAIPCIYGIKHKEVIPIITARRLQLKQYNWITIFWSLLPGIIIAIGAGLAIPFMNLFFYSVHGLNSNAFAIVGAVAGTLVSFAFFVAPYLKRKRGYIASVVYTQCIAVIALYTMAATAWYAGHPYIIMIAVAAFLVRQPFMNMASAMTSELSMEYAGPQNQEMVSALTSALWSGSWFFSAHIFATMRRQSISYGYILLTTAIIYTAGTIGYYLLILANQRKKQQRIAGDIIFEIETAENFL